MPRTYRPVTAEDRASIRPRPHHGHVRPAQNPLRDGRATRSLRSRQGTHHPDSAAVQALSAGRKRLDPEKLWARLPHPLQHRLCRCLCATCWCSCPDIPAACTTAGNPQPLHTNHTTAPLSSTPRPVRPSSTDVELSPTCTGPNTVTEISP